MGLRLSGDKVRVIMEYFFTYVLNTKNILKIVVLLNMIFLLRLIWAATFGIEVTSIQSDGAVFAVLVIIICTLYRWIVLGDE